MRRSTFLLYSRSLTRWRPMPTAISPVERQAPYWLAVLRGGVLYSEMVLEWCDESARRLRDLRKAGTGDGPAEAPRPYEDNDR